MDEKYLEQASAIQEHRNADAIADIQRGLQATGQADCEDCGDPIATARRKAMPSAIRCINCQTAIDYINQGYTR